MHIPDGFLSTPVWATLNLASVPAVGYMARRAQQQLEESRIPRLGVMGAFVFAAQMINFAVGLGTSGHLVGGTLLAVTLGVPSAAVVMTAILAVQALVFQDGGILALGANVFNMAIIGVLAGYLPYHLWGGGSWRRAAIFCGGVLSLLVSALLAIAELIASGVAIRGAVLGASMLVFLVNAILEGAITLAVVEAVERLNPNWVRRPEPARDWAGGLLILGAVLLAVVGVLLASGAPDGLERMAENLGIAEHARNLLPSAFPDYEAEWLSGDWLKKATAGLVGLALIYVLCHGAGRLLARRS
jgi:cobalt/nickel transport system permease protein